MGFQHLKMGNYQTLKNGKKLIFQINKIKKQKINNLKNKFNHKFINNYPMIKKFMKIMATMKYGSKTITSIHTL